MEEIPSLCDSGQQVAEAEVLLEADASRDDADGGAALHRLRRNCLGVDFRRQQIVHGFIADFDCNPARLVVEVDGAVHDAEYDTERDRIFAQHGLRCATLQQ